MEELVEEEDIDADGMAEEELLTSSPPFLVEPEGNFILLRTFPNFFMVLNDQTMDAVIVYNEEIRSYCILVLFQLKLIMRYDSDVNE